MSTALITRGHVCLKDLQLPKALLRDQRPFMLFLYLSWWSLSPLKNLQFGATSQLPVSTLYRGYLSMPAATPPSGKKPKVHTLLSTGLHCSCLGQSMHQLEHKPTLPKPVLASQNHFYLKQLVVGKQVTSLLYYHGVLTWLLGGKKKFLNSAIDKVSRKFTSNSTDFLPGTLEMRSLRKGSKTTQHLMPRFYSRYWTHTPNWDSWP